MPFPSSDHTRGLGGQRHHPPIWSCSGWGLPGQPVTRLPVVSYTTFSPLPIHPGKAPLYGTSGWACPWDQRPWGFGRYVSVALSLKSPSLGVAQHPALWSPDFPRTPQQAASATTWPAYQQYNKAGGRRQSAYSRLTNGASPRVPAFSVYKGSNIMSTHDSKL